MSRIPNRIFTIFFNIAVGKYRIKTIEMFKYAADKEHEF